MKQLRTFNSNDKIAVISNDAGATNLIVNWVKLFKGSILPHMTGPAKKIWEENFPDITLMDLEKSVTEATIILTGTGWGSKSEKVAREFAKKNNVYSIAVLDHWTNYSLRLDKNNYNDLPNEIWITDLEAQKEVNKYYPKIKTLLMPNNYLIETLKEIDKASKTNIKQIQKKLLYLLEPIHVCWPGSEIPEIQALNYFLKNYDALTENNDVEIILRPHPSEEISKYQKWLSKKEKRYNLRITNSESLASQIAQADFIFGCETYAMEIASNAGKPTFSTIPPWGHRGSLKCPEIEYLSDLIPKC